MHHRFISDKNKIYWCVRFVFMNYEPKSTFDLSSASFFFFIQGVSKMFLQRFTI